MSDAKPCPNCGEPPQSPEELTELAEVVALAKRHAALAGTVIHRGNAELYQADMALADGDTASAPRNLVKYLIKQDRAHEAKLRRLPGEKYPKLMEPWNLEPHYSEHIGAMTAENLHSKHDIAEQLAWRDQQLEVANARIIELRAEVAVERSGCDTALECLEQHTVMNRQLIEAFDNLEDDGARDWEVRAVDLLTKGVKLLSCWAARACKAEARLEEAAMLKDCTDEKNAAVGHVVRALTRILDGKGRAGLFGDVELQILAKRLEILRAQ